ncbi:MAG: transglutaminase domain-containing protein [candidate division Zixibacteria bacterium]|nr:transglutaminase domain-containing protein [candidate division Zixibacteria bacterium]
MCKKSIRRVTANGSMHEKILYKGEHIILKPLILMLFLFACFNLLVPSGIMADETDNTGIGLYKDGEKVADFEDIVKSSILNNRNDGAANLTPMAKEYLEYVKKSDDYYRHPSVIFYNLVKRCKNLINTVHSDNLDVDSPEAAMLNNLITRVMDSHDSMLEENRQAKNEMSGSGMPADEIQKQNADMEEFEARTAELIGLLESCQFSVEQKDYTTFNNSITALQTHFDEMDAERIKRQEVISFTPPKPSVTEYKDLPRMKGERPKLVYTAAEYHGSDNLRDDPDPIYLDETIEIQFTDDIVALAAELNHSPVEIYQYVRNNFDFEIYYGSRKGAQQTLDDQAGNDYDLASLLIALLRSSGIYARYNIAEAVIPDDRLCNWLGVDDPVKAEELLVVAGFAADLNDNLMTLSLVYVEANVPDVNYRGAGNDSNVKNWIPLDPSFKQYQYSSAINLLDELTEAFDAEVFIREYYTAVPSITETPLEWFQQAMIDSLADYHPDAVYDDFIRTITVIEEPDEILPGTLPYSVNLYGDHFAAIPDDDRYKITFKVTRGALTYISYTTSLPEIAGKQITVSHVGAYVDIDRYGGIYSVPPGVLRTLWLKPVLKIDGCEVSVASSSYLVATAITVSVEFDPPGENTPVQPEVETLTKGGDYVGIGINTGDTFPVQFDAQENSCYEAYAGQLLYKTAKSYLNSTKVHENTFREILHTKSSSDVSVAFVFNDIGEVREENWPYDLIEIKWGGFIIDSKGGAEIHVSTDLECLDYTEEYIRLSGADGSIGENRVFEDYLGVDAVSAIKILQETYENYLPVCDVDDDLDDECPGWREFCPDNYEDQIILLLDDYLESEYYTVTMPKHWTTYGEAWEGYGMIIMHNPSGKARYVLIGHIDHDAGGGALYYADGGATTWLGQWQIDAFPDAHCVGIPEGILVDPYVPGDLYCPASTDYLTFIVPTITHYSLPPTCEDLGSEGMAVILPWTLEHIVNTWGPGEYTFTASIGIGECPLCNSASRSIGIVNVEIEQEDVGNCVTENSAWLDISAIESYSPGGYTWYSTPPGISGEGDAIEYDPSSLPLGEYTVRAESNDHPECYDEITVAILEVDKIQYEYPAGTWNDISETSPLYVLQGSMVNFKAVPEPEVPWPDDMPHWGGSSGANGTGEIIAVTFNFTSSSLTDYKTVTAMCEDDGTPIITQVTTNAIVYNINESLSLVPDDNFTGRSQDEYGLEETVHLDFVTVPAGVTASQAGDLRWSKHSGVGNVTNITNAGTADYDAMHIADDVTFRLTVQSGPSSGHYKEYDRTVIAPNGTRMTRASGNVWHIYGHASAGIALDYWLDPTHVSFGNLTFGEGSCPAVGATGIYITVPPGNHAQNFFGGILGGNITTGCRVDFPDGPKTDYLPWDPGGTYTWNIPTQYIDDTASRHTFGANQIHTPVIQPNGTTTMNKGGQSGTAAVNDPSSGW